MNRQDRQIEGEAAFWEFNQPTADGPQPKYEQLRNYVVSQIESGNFKAGSSLPSEHRIAEILKIARSTVRQAMATLEREGLVRRVHGKGTFVHEQARQRLKKGQDLFALIMPETETGFYPSLQKSVEEAAAELNSQVIVCNSGNEIDRQGNSILQLIDLQVAGVAIIPTTNPPTPAYHIRQLQQHGIPVVCCSRPVEGIQAPLLAIPFEGVGRKAGDVLKEHGHVNVAFLTADRTEWTKAMERGFRDSLGPQAQIRLFIGDSSSPDVSLLEEKLLKATREWGAEPDAPTAYFATFDSMLELLFVLLNREGRRVPEDVSLLGFGGKRRFGAIASRLTSITLDEQQLGQEAVELLNRMRNGEVAIDLSETRQLQLGLNVGETLKKLTR